MILSYDHIYDCFTGQVPPPGNRNRRTETPNDPKPKTQHKGGTTTCRTNPRPEHKPRTHRHPRTPQNNRNQGRGMYHPQDDLRLIPSTRTSPNQPRTEPNLTLPTVLDKLTESMSRANTPPRTRRRAPAMFAFESTPVLDGKMHGS